MRPTTRIAQLAEREARKAMKKQQHSNKNPNKLFAPGQAQRAAAAEKNRKAQKAERPSFWLTAPREGFTALATAQFARES